MKIEIKSYKSCRAKEGDAFSCTLYLDGKKAAYVTYDGWGGAYRFDWSATKGHKRMHGGPLGEEFQRYVDGLPEEDGLKKDMDWVVSDAITEMLEERQLKRWCKKKTVFRLKDTPKGQVEVLDVVYSPRIRLHLKADHGEDLVEIVNERFAA